MRLPVLLGALALAGCLGVPSTPPAPGEAGPGILFTSMRLPGERDGGEPNVAVAPDGTVYVVAPPGLISTPNWLRSEVNLWRSEDGGATWTHLREPSAKGDVFCSCDADVDIGPDGVVYLTDFPVLSNPSGRSVNGFVVERSTDKGATWSRGNPVTVTNPTANDRQWILAGASPGVVYLAYARGGGVGPILSPDDGLWFLKSTDGGDTFPQIAQVLQPPLDGSRFPQLAHPRLAPDGTLYFPYVDSPTADFWNGSSTLNVAVSRDDGRTWEHRDVADIPEGTGGLWAAQMDTDAEGTLWAAWMARPGETGSVVWFASSRDAGATWSEPRAASWPMGTAGLPWIAAHGGGGRVAIAFYGTPDRHYHLSAPEGTEWYAWVTLVEGERASPPVRASGGPVKVGPLCMYGAACPQDRDLLDYLSLEFAPDASMLYVAYSVSRLDEGVESGGARDAPEGAHQTAAYSHIATARLPRGDREFGRI